MISALLAPRLVSVCVRGAGSTITIGPARVRAPLASEAITLLESAEAASRGLDVRPLVHDALRRWLPLSMASTLTARTFSTSAALEVGLYLITAGLPESILEKHRQESDRARKKVKSTTWQRLTSDLAAIYGGDPLAWPWPLFCARLEDLDAVRARYEYSVATAAAMVMTGKGWDGIMKRLGLEEDYEAITEEEQIEKLEAWKRRFAGFGMGVS